jgi:hypothetical protein
MHSPALFGAALGFAAAICSSTSSAASPLEELGRAVPGLGEAGIGGFAVADFDGDSRPDLAIPAVNGGSVIVEILGEVDGSLGVKQILLLPDASLVRVLVSNASGAPRLLTLGSEGTVREFGGWPLAELRDFPLDDQAFKAAAVGDIDADGSEELVVSAPPWYGAEDAFVSVYDLATGARRWTLPGVGGGDIVLEQLDADPALEIVLAGTPGVILDGATEASDWSYKDGFGNYLAAGHFEDGGGGQFVAAHDWDVFTIFQSAPYSPVWDASVFDIDAIAAADLDGDGFDEIIEGDGQWGGVNIYDSKTHDVRLGIPHASWGISALAAGAFVDPGAASIAFGSRQAVFDDEDVLRIVDASNGSTQWELDAAMPGPYAPVALGDVDGDGSTEFLYASVGNVYSHGVISQMDALGGEAEWQSPMQNGNANDPYYMLPIALGAVPGEGGHSGRIIVAGTSIYAGRILGIDGATHEVLYQVGTYAAGPMNHRYVAGMTTDDLDDDGTPEIAVCTYAADTGASGARLFVFSSDDGSLLWESIALGSGFDGCKGVMTGHFDEGADPLVVAVMPSSLRAFDASTHLLAWTMPIAADGATLLPRGVAGREFVVFSGSTLTFFDAATRAELRRFDVGADVLAVRESRDIGSLIVAAGGRLLLVDGAGGSILGASGFLGNGLGAANQLALDHGGDGTYLVGAGSNVGAFRYRLTLTESIFANGFEMP